MPPHAALVKGPMVGAAQRHRELIAAPLEILSSRDILDASAVGTRHCVPIGDGLALVSGNYRLTFEIEGQDAVSMGRLVRLG